MENFPRPAHRPEPDKIAERQKFLLSARPFNLLPHSEIETVAANLTEQSYPEGATVFVQEETVLPHVLILRAGFMERIIRRNSEAAAEEVLEPGAVYGGISLLFNHGVSTSTVYCVSSVSAYCLDRENFLRLCAKHPGFAGYFSRAMEASRQTAVSADLAQAAESTSEIPAGAFPDKIPGEIAKTFPACSAATSIRQAAGILTASGKSALLVLDENSMPEGIITDEDLRTKVIVEGRSPEKPAGEIMSAPLISVDSDAPVFDAILLMMRHGIKHLAVFENRLLKGVITERDLFFSRNHSPVFLVHEIRSAARAGQLKEAYAKLPEMVSDLILSGAGAEYLNSIITAITDSVLAKVVENCIGDLGRPPAEFAFLVFGSEGRKEQTLKTDQDNAIVYRDSGTGNAAETQEYFREFGRRVCDTLDEIGQKHCEFDIMAKNPAWCQPLSKWETYYRRWVESDDPARILQAGIFFDFRLGYGSRQLVDDLHEALFDVLSEWPGFLRHMARNTLHYRPPLGFFGNFVLQEKGQGKGRLDIKSAMRLLVDFGRIYAMETRSEETNTINRLLNLHRQNRMEKHQVDDLVHAYDFLMYQRLRHQSESMRIDGTQPDNFIQPSDLTTIDQQALKEAFKQIRMAQARLRMDFFLYLP
ncbi:MAG: DUF294 nucleotidyltransferase-like domain-containing protein [Thermodesulfobacteriota bacterium]